MTATSAGELRADPATTSPADGASTRHLCAGAHLSRVFTRQVLDAVYRQPRRAVGPAGGIDTGLVIRHCVAAYRRRLWRDLVLAVIVLGAAAASASGRSPRLGALLLAAWGVVLVEVAVVRYEVLAARLRPREPDLRLPTSPRLRARIAEIERAQAVNVTVYSGFAPFVGSGVDLGGWSFAVDLEKGKEVVGVRRTPRPVGLGVLRERVVAAVLASGLDGLSVSDGVWIDGTRADALPIRPGGPLTRPVGYLDPAVVRGYADTTAPGIRHYHRIQVTGWGGQIVMSIFLRFLVVRGRLYAEANYSFLPPANEAWSAVDLMESAPTVGRAFALAGRAAAATPAAVALAVPRVLLAGFRVWVAEPMDRWSERAAVRAGAVADVGARTTVRQLGTSARYSRYFQRLDRERYVKLLEPAVLDTVIAVLDESDVDTSDLADRQGTILNQGVLMTGGSLQAESLAVGTAAKVTARVRRVATTAGRQQHDDW